MADQPAATGSPPPSVDPQDPLPESNWLWRRVFVFLFCTALLFGLWFRTDDLATVALTGDKTAITGLIDTVKWLIATFGGLILLYLVSPSAEQVAKMLATVSAWKSGVSTTSTSSAIGPDGSSARATTSAGPAKQTMAVGNSGPELMVPTGDEPATLPWRKL